MGVQLYHYAFTALNWIISQSFIDCRTSCWEARETSLWFSYAAELFCVLSAVTMENVMPMTVSESEHMGWIWVLMLFCAVNNACMGCCFFKMLWCFIFVHSQQIDWESSLFVLDFSPKKRFFSWPSMEPSYWNFYVFSWHCNRLNKEKKAE